MKLAIMQPYFFPYLGYFQLIRAVDKFLFYDDVNYIKSGWINRNRILLNGQSHFITVPTSGASSNVLISQVGINVQNSRWRRKLLDGFQQAYSRAPHRDTAQKLLQKVLDFPTDRVSEFAKQSVIASLELLGIKSTILWSSSTYQNAHLHAQERVIDICRREKATTYVNAIGGRELYDPAGFAENGARLSFIRAVLPTYRQDAAEFVMGLSILDVIAYAGIDGARAMTHQVELVDD